MTGKKIWVFLTSISYGFVIIRSKVLCPMDKLSEAFAAVLVLFCFERKKEVRPAIPSVATSRVFAFLSPERDTFPYNNFKTVPAQLGRKREIFVFASCERLSDTRVMSNLVNLDRWTDRFLRKAASPIITANPKEI